MKFVKIILILSISCKLFAQNRDLQMVKTINSNRISSLDRPLDILSSSTDFVSIGLPAFILAKGIIKNNASLTQKGINVGVAVIGTYGIAYILQVDRARPYVKDPSIDFYKIENDASFPSGSTSLAFATATNLALVSKKWFVIAPAYAYAASVGYARLHLGVHYPTDVLAGAALGTASAFVSKGLNNALRNQVRKRRLKANK
jgi:membrane-associated phospholipid phosphatase